MASPSERNLNRLREALGRDYVDPLRPSKESRTRSELLRGEGPPSDVTAPEDQDMWEEDGGGDGEGGGSLLTGLPDPEDNDYLSWIQQSTVYNNDEGEPALLAASSTGELISVVPAVKRPDLYPGFYGGARRMESTRVAAMQWIPTYVDFEDVDESGESQVIGDLLVAFARPSGGGVPLYVYNGVSKGMWRRIKNESVSFGREVNKLDVYHRYEGSDGDRYRELHPSYDYWIFNDLESISAGRSKNESATYSYERASIRKVAGVRRADERRKRAARAAERREAKKKGS